MSSSTPTRTAASAPGKVLLAGGYLVVDRAHTGLVFGLGARMHVVVEGKATEEGAGKVGREVEDGEDDAATGKATAEEGEAIVEGEGGGGGGGGGGRGGEEGLEGAEEKKPAEAEEREGGGDAEASMREAGAEKGEASSQAAIQMVVRSPQFDEAEWIYECAVEGERKGVSVNQKSDCTIPRNKFVETALAYALSYVVAQHPSTSPLTSAVVTILADDDYYSHGTTATPCESNPNSRFHRFNVSLSDAHKTGLGSSAALVTALVAAVARNYLGDANGRLEEPPKPESKEEPKPAENASTQSPFGSVKSNISSSLQARIAKLAQSAEEKKPSQAPPKLTPKRTPKPRSPASLSEAWTTRVHNLAQAAHCAAQGKIGSGFDVGAAVHGSCLYRRFSPSVLEQIGEANSPDFSTRLTHVVNDVDGIWDAEFNASAVGMPSSLRLVMCDVDCGSETPGMVRQVFAWRKDHPDDAQKLWKKLELNTQLVAQTLRQMADGTYPAPPAMPPGVPPPPGPTHGTTKLRLAFTHTRDYQRTMSMATGVPIEPPSQTRLLDACMAVHGVVGGVVPGAGGYDAVALLVADEEEVMERLKALLEGWEVQEDEGEAGDGIEKRMGKVRLLGVREEMEGLRIEKGGLYEGWL